MTIFTQVRQAFPNFPSDDSTFVKGIYNGTPFTVYLDAEIEVEDDD